jgi:tripartite-type tricarboxylate transporter receptor subunit TctC
LPVNSVGDLIALAKAKPGTLTFASLGRGTSLHLAAELFKTMAGIDIVHVPYKGTTTALPDLMSGRVNMIFDGGAMFSQAQAGKVRLLATTSPQRLESLPDLPTMSEAGVPGYEVVIWFGVVAPAGTPKPIIERLAKEVAGTVKQPSFKQRFAGTGIEPVSNTPEAFAELIRKDTVKWTQVLRDAGIPQE